MYHVVSTSQDHNYFIDHNFQYESKKRLKLCLLWYCFEFDSIDSNYGIVLRGGHFVDFLKLSS